VIVSVDPIKHPAWVFRVYTDGPRRTRLHASCVIESITGDKCNIIILNIVDSITMQELRPKIKAKVMALGFTDYEFSRTYNGPNIKRGVR